MAKINHIGIIVDGNGRWAKERGLKRTEGHKEGSKVVEKIIKYTAKKELANYLSLYVFSTENFDRSEEEVNYLMNLFMSWFKHIQKDMNKYNIKIVFSSHKELLRKDIVKMIDEITEKTKNNTGLVVNFCLSYGGRCELVDATKKIAKDIIDKKYSIDAITEKTINDNLYQQLPDIDFLIRTSGESRISNFMLWQISYAELYFPKTYFPDFNEEELEKAITEYQSRDRRFGKIKNN